MGPKLKITGSDYGQILASGRGRALYLFTADKGKASSCSGDCATAWPPYIVRSKPVAGPGAKSGLIGVNVPIVTRQDGAESPQPGITLTVPATEPLDPLRAAMRSAGLLPHHPQP